MMGHTIIPMLVGVVSAVSSSLVFYNSSLIIASTRRDF